jgi:hypothetical protein
MTNLSRILSRMTFDAQVCLLVTTGNELFTRIRMPGAECSKLIGTMIAFNLRDVKVKMAMEFAEQNNSRASDATEILGSFRMRLLVVPAVGIVGGIVFGSWGLLPNSESTTSMTAHSNQIVTRMVAKPMIEDALSNSIDLDETHDDVRSTVDHGTLPAWESALRRKIELLESGYVHLNSCKDYQATFRKEEVVKGELLEEQVMAIKCREKPFSVYLHWLAGDVGREVIFVDGRNDGKMIAHDGGWKARIPAFTLSTDCMLAMRDARYPVTSAGISGLIEIMLSVHRDDLIRCNVASCQCEPHQRFQDRPCEMFTTIYKSRSESPVYRKSITFIDEQWNVPIHSRHFEWPSSKVKLTEDELDGATLIESYSFTDIEFGCNLTDHDFDPKHPEYHFR